MPTYLCMTRTGSLDDGKRREIATAISKAHSEATGAPTFFVQVVFDERDEGRRFLGGEPCDSHIWIRGDIRAGRTVEQRTGLMLAIMRGVARIAGVAESDVWVYLCELEPTDMIEYGHVLPKPGEEATWFAGLPAALREALERLDTRGESFKL